MTIKSPRLLLTILAALSSLLASNFTLRLLHMLPPRGRLGIYEFFGHDLLGAVLWAVLTLLWAHLAIGLLRRDPNGWILSLVLSAATLVLAGASFIGESNWRAVLPVMAINGLILVICSLPGTKARLTRQPIPPAALD